MLDNPPILTIHRGFQRPDAAVIEAFRGAQTSHLVDAMDGRGALDYRIKPLDPSMASFVGPALTAFAYPADVAAVFGALSEALPGDVIVVANDAFTRTAVLGDIAAGMMKNKGVAAFVTDGLARDKAGIIATGLPVFCAGIQPNSPGDARPGRGRRAVTLSDVPVCPGDIVVGDADGVVIVPAARAHHVLERLTRIRTAEARTIALVEQGATMAAGAQRIIDAAVIVG